jgi:hypothetical protein
MKTLTPEEFKKLSFQEKSEYLKKDAEMNGIGWGGGIFPKGTDTIISATIAETLPKIQPDQPNQNEVNSNGRENN